MGVNNRSSLDPRYKKHARGPLKGFVNCHVQLIDPNTDGASLNPWTNALSSSPAVLWEGDVTMNVFRQTLNAWMPVGSVTQIRSVRFTIPDDGPAVPITKGLQIRMLTCEDQPDLTHFQYTVTGGITGSFAFTRDIEAESDQAVVLP